MTRLVICRHANTFDKGDVVRRVGARTDLPLSSSGLRQGKFLSQEFSPEKSGFNFVRAYCSPLQRTRETGKLILHSGHSIQTLISLPFLTEIDYGMDENKSEEDVVLRVGKTAIKLWDEQAIPPQGWNVEPETIIQSWRQFFDRIRSLDGDTLVVSSNGITRFALDAVDEIDTEAPRKLRTAAFGIVDITSDKVTVVDWDKRELFEGHTLKTL